MKKQLLLFYSIFLFILPPLSFANTKVSTNTVLHNYNSYGEKFTFIERGITFSVFQNGEFDFYINNVNTIHTNINFGRVNISYNSGYNYDYFVQYDDYGAIIQIESVPIYYDYYGRISRIGNIRISYFNNRLIRIGNLHIYYNPYGLYSHFTGYINYYNKDYVYNPYHDFFVRPAYNRCIVSYNPYRRYYNPHRYEYNSYRHKKDYYKKGAFKDVNSRITNVNHYNTRTTVNSHPIRYKRSSTLNRNRNSSYSHTARNVYNKKIMSQRNIKSNRNNRSLYDVKEKNDFSNKKAFRDRKSGVKGANQIKTVERVSYNDYRKQRNKNSNISKIQRNLKNKPSNNRSLARNTDVKIYSKRKITRKRY